MMFPELESEMGPLSAEEIKQSKKFMKLIVNFMNGNNMDNARKEFKNWKPVVNNQMSYLAFGKQSKTLKNLPHQERIKFWNDLHKFWKKNHKSFTSKSEL